MRIGNSTRALWLLASSCAVLAQSPPVIRTFTHLVEVSVTATDTHGRHAGGLQRSQFEVLDGGVRQRIVFFSEHAVSQPVASALPEGVFTNQPGTLPGAAPAPPTVVLFDALNTRFSEQFQAREALRKFLESAGGRAIALYGLNTRLLLLSDFTADPVALERGLDAFAPTENLNRMAAAPRAAATGLPTDYFENLSAESEAKYYMPERRVRPTIAALTAIADRIAAIPGRKNLVWVSGSFPVSFGLGRSRVFIDPMHDAATFGEELAPLARRLNSANIAVYPVNTAGVASLDLGVEDHLSPMSPGFSATLLPDSGYRATLTKIAEWTGGTVTSSNDIGDQLRKSFDDGRQDYLLAFYAPRWDGKYHELRVSVHTPGVKARTRKGYYAVDEPAIDPAKRLRDAVADAADAMEIPMEVAPVKKGAAGHWTVTTRAHVPGSALAFEKTADGWTAGVRLVFVQIDAAGKRLSQLDQDLSMKLSETKHALAATEGLRFTTPVAMRGSAAQLRVLLQDRASGAVGSVTMELDRIARQP